MKRYKSLTEKYLMLEGKQQAIQVLKKGNLSDFDINFIIEEIEQLDPTKPKNKYLEVFANSDRIMAEGFLLGAHHGMVVEDCDYVCDKIKEFFLLQTKE